MKIKIRIFMTAEIAENIPEIKVSSYCESNYAHNSISYN